MTDTRTQEPGGQQRLSTEVEGRTLRWWIGVAVLIAAVTLGVGAWWVWGLDQDMGMGDMGGMDPMDGMAHTDVRLPPVQGLYEGEEIFFVHPEASDEEVAAMLTEMMGGSPVLVVPELADVPAEVVDDVYVFTNGVQGPGPFGYQPDVFASAPGDDGYSPLREVVLVTWTDEDEARQLGSAAQIRAAEEAGELELEASGTVVNMPLLTWPDGQR